MSDAAVNEVPDGASVFPEIPAALGVHPLLLAVLHVVVFLEGSDSAIVHPAAAAEAIESVAAYLQRLQGRDLQRVQEDLTALVGLARQEKWPRQQIQFLKSFLTDYGVGGANDE